MGPLERSLELLECSRSAPDLAPTLDPTGRPNVHGGSFLISGGMICPSLEGHFSSLGNDSSSVEGHFSSLEGHLSSLEYIFSFPRGHTPTGLARRFARSD